MKKQTNYENLVKNSHKTHSKLQWQQRSINTAKHVQQMLSDGEDYETGQLSGRRWGEDAGAPGHRMARQVPSDDLNTYSHCSKRNVNIPQNLCREYYFLDATWQKQ